MQSDTPILYAAFMPPKPTVTKERIAELLSRGLSVREVSNVTGLSTQRVYQLKAKIAQSQEPPEERASL